MRHFRKQSIKKITLSVILVFCIIFSQTALIYAEAAVEADTEYLRTILEFIDDKYKGTPIDDQLMEGALRGLFNSLDPYSTYFSPEEAEDYYSAVGGTYSGIGIVMELSGEYVEVSKVYEDSPAELAGLLQLDKIVEVDGTSMIGKTIEEVHSAIVGETGSKVQIGISRKGAESTIYFDLTRDVIKENPITYIIKDEVGYIKLATFNYHTDTYLTEALKAMDEAGKTDIILDLRGNGGGIVEQAVAVAQKFVTSGLITKLDFKADTSSIYEDIEYRSYLSQSKYNLVVLVDGMSASASEILAGAIQDTDAGTIVGSITYGKGKFQGTIPLLTPEAYAKYKLQLGIDVVDVNDLYYKYDIEPLDSEIIGYAKITLGYYYTPDGRMIDETGILPDISVADTAEIFGMVLSDAEKLTKTVKPVLNDQCSDVYNAELILKLLGYKIDKPDTLFDENTLNQIKAFQKASGLYAYGGLDFTTQGKLNSALDGIMLKYDMQYAKAVEILRAK